MRARPNRKIVAALLAAVLGIALPASGSEWKLAGLDESLMTEAIITIRNTLPEGWDIVEIAWETVPHGWKGESTCVFIRCEDTLVQFPHPQGFSYHPFWKLWFLPPSWEGRMEVAKIEPSAPQALYLGENRNFRLLGRTLGRNTWPEAIDVLAAALELNPFPLSHNPRHSLDIGAMQRLFQRLDNAGRLSRFQPQIYGIAELPDLVYLELLTWEDRTGKGARDPTFLGKLAETETRFLTREVLAAFPTKRGLYLRRVTRESFSDVLVVNPACLATVN